MRFKTSILCTDRLKEFKELRDLDYSALQSVIEHAEISIGHKGDKLFECAYNDSNAVFLLQGSIKLSSQILRNTYITCRSTEASNRLNKLIPQGGSILATSADTALLIIKFKYIDAARLSFNKPLDTINEAFAIHENIIDGQSNDWMSTLLSSPLFHRLNPTQLQKLLQSFKEENYCKGETVIQKGQHDSHFYIIKSGRAKVLLAPSKYQCSDTLILEPGNFFGEGAITGDTVHSATVQMEEDGVICLINSEQFDELLKENALEYISEEQMVEKTICPDATEIMVLDVRLPIEFKKGHRENSINIPVDRLRSELNNALPKEVTYIIEYGEDKRSQVAALILIEHGFNAFLLKQTEEKNLKTG